MTTSSDLHSSTSYLVYTNATSNGGTFLTDAAGDANVRANVIVFGANTAAVVDYSYIFGKMVNLMIKMESNIATIQSHINQIRSNVANINLNIASINTQHTLIAGDIDTIRLRAENHDLGIVTRTSNTDCWTDTCVYDYSLVEMALRDSNILGQYNQIVADNGGAPIT